MIQHEQITLENQKPMGDMISKSQLSKCDAVEDAPVNQVLFRITPVGEHSVLGFSKIQSGDVIYTGLKRMKNARVDEYDLATQSCRSWKAAKL